MRKLLSVAAMLAVGTVWAAPTMAVVAAPMLGQAASSRTAADDEEEDEGPPPASTSGKAPVANEGNADAAPAVLQPSSNAVPAGAPAEQQLTDHEQVLVSGAPLNNPNVAVHIVEQKRFGDRGRREIVLYPIWAQANGKFTQHYGTALSALWHVHENFALQIGGMYNWVNIESGFNTELVERTKNETGYAASLLLQWGAIAGVEVTPLYGKFAWYQDVLAHFSVFFSGGAGVGGSRHLLWPKSTRYPDEIYGDTGLRFLGQVGGGVRLQIGERFAARVELRDIVYTAAVDRINGCSHDDFVVMAANPNRPNPPVSNSCSWQSFVNDPGASSTQRPASEALAPAERITRIPTSDALNNLGIFLGVSFLF